MRPSFGRLLQRIGETLACERLGIAPVWKAYSAWDLEAFAAASRRNEMSLRIESSSWYGEGHFCGGTTLWFVHLGTDSCFSCCYSARFSSSERRVRMIACANGPPARFMRRNKFPAHLIVRRNRMATRGKVNSNSPLRREKHSAFFNSQALAPWITPHVLATISVLTGFVLRPFPNTSSVSPSHVQHHCPLSGHGGFL